MSLTIKVGLKLYDVDSIVDTIKEAGAKADYVIIEPAVTSIRGKYWVQDYPIKVYDIKDNLLAES